MTVEVVAAGPLMRDELQAVASMLCTRFPEHGRLEVEWLVTGVYDGLSATARIRAHLIPLTLNRCRLLLSESQRERRRRPTVGGG
jgi:hypothetical protein